MDSSNQTGDGGMSTQTDTQPQIEEQLRVEPDPNFVNINSKEPDSIAQAYKAIDEGKKVLLDEIGLNSSELTKLDKFAKSKETEIFMNMNIIQHPVLVGHYS